MNHNTCLASKTAVGQLLFFLFQKSHFNCYKSNLFPTYWSKPVRKEAKKSFIGAIIHGLTFDSIIIKLSIMPLLTILIVLIVVGVVLWLINTYIPMDNKIKNILNVVVVIVVIFWLLKAFGLLDNLKGIRV
jgi:hypothetical protein